MATKNFTQFSTATPLTTGDYIVGYKADASAELKTTVQSIINLVQDSDNQTLSFDENSKDLAITSGNTVSLSTFATNTDFNSYKTDVAAATATLLPTTVYQSASGVWQDTFTNVQSNSSNWNEAYNAATTYQSASGSFATNTLLQSTSALLTPLTLTNTLTGQLVLNTDFNSYKTNVASATATLLPTTTYQSASGSFVLNTDARLSDVRTPTSHTHTASAITDSTSAGRTLLTSSLANQRVHLDLFPSFPTRNDFPIIGEANRIYSSQETQRIYAYLGLFLGYVEIAPPRCEFICACSDEITLLTTGVAKMTFRAPYNFRLTNARASVNEAPTGSTIIVDINKNGTTVLSTKLSIDATEKTSFTAAVPLVISVNTFQTDNEITIDLDHVGSTSAGKGLKVTLIGIRT